MGKKFTQCSNCEMSSLYLDGIEFIKSDNEFDMGMVFSDVDNSALSFSFKFQISKLTFSKEEVAHEIFNTVSFSFKSDKFKYVFDNDEMLTQFCEFYGLGR
jgi:hypothetical protein